MRHRTAYLRDGSLSEEVIQRAVAQFLRIALPQGCGVMWAHFPMGGKRPYGEAGKLNGMGAKAGVLDLYFRWAGHVGWIELKSERGKLSGEQKAFIAEVTPLGDLTALARSVEEVEGILRGWLPPGTLRATLMPGGGVRRTEPDLRLPTLYERQNDSNTTITATDSRAARPVRFGASWTFPDHRTLADVGVSDFSGGVTQA